MHWADSNSRVTIAQEARRANCLPRLLANAVVFLLVLGIVCLSTITKHSQYLPNSHPIHYIAKAAKMEANHLPVLGAPLPIYTAEKLTPPPQDFDGRLLVVDQTIEFLQIALALSLQHRSPPQSPVS